MTAQPIAERREAPRSLSTAIERAMGCERYFVMRYLYDQPRIAGGESATRSRVFHSYRRDYIQHLREEERPKDPLWVKDWVKSTTITEDASDLILSDAEWFSINPDDIYATDLFLGLDKEFELIEREAPARAGRYPVDESVRWHGTIEYIEIADTSARVIVTKTGWTDANLHDYEGAHSAGLLFAALPYLKDIDFSYSFTRTKAATIPMAYNRQQDYHWIQEQMRRRWAAMQQLIKLYEADGPVSPNPTAGLCKHCNYTCPIRSAAEKGLLIDKPLQTDRDAVELARRVLSANFYVLNGRRLLESYLEQGKSLSLGNGLVAEMRAGTDTEYRLDRVLEVLGVEAPENSRAFDVPLSGLKVGSTALKTYAKAQKRAGFMEKLLSVARIKPKFKLHIGKPGNTEDDE